MNYKNINLNELGTSSKIIEVGKRKAMLVPRLLSKLATKLVLEPVTKLTTGQSFEQVKDATISVTMEMQKVEAEPLKEQINEGVQNLNDWANDKEYFISNLAKYRQYQKSIEKLSKKYNKLVSSPKKLLVAKNYFLVMKTFSEKHKEVKQAAKDYQRIINEYNMKRSVLLDKEKAVQSIELVLEKARQELNDIRKEVNTFKEENIEIISQLPEEVEHESVVEAEFVPVQEEVASNMASEPAVVTVEPEVKKEESVTVEPVVVQENEVSNTEDVVDQSGLSETALEQINSFVMSTSELQEKAADMPLFNSNGNVPVQTEADKDTKEKNAVVPNTEDVVDQSELSETALEQINSFVMSTSELQEKAAEMPLFNSVDSVPVQTEADKDLLVAMGNFARLFPSQNISQFETYGLDETSKSL